MAEGRPRVEPATHGPGQPASDGTGVWEVLPHGQLQPPAEPTCRLLRIPDEPAGAAQRRPHPAEGVQADAETQGKAPFIMFPGDPLVAGRQGDLDQDPPPVRADVLAKDPGQVRGVGGPAWARNPLNLLTAASKSGSGESSRALRSHRTRVDRSLASFVENFDSARLLFLDGREDARHLLGGTIWGT